MYIVLRNSNWRETARFPTLAEARSEAFRLRDCTVVDESIGKVVPYVPDIATSTGSGLVFDGNIGFCKTDLFLEECTRLGIPVEVIKLDE